MIFSSVSTLIRVQSKLDSMTAVEMWVIFTAQYVIRNEGPMRILVTGAHGCIGAWVVKHILERRLDVLMFDVDAEPGRLGMIAPLDLLAKAAVRIGRIEDTAGVKAPGQERRHHHIIHLAAQLIPFCQTSPVAGAMANVIGTLNIFEAARDAGRPVRVVYASSAAVWGPAELYGDRELTEEDKINPGSHYGIFKQTNEANARVFFELDGISSVGLRPWTVYGVGRDRGLTADPTLAIRAVALGEPFEIRLTGYMDFQYVEDVAEAFIACALSQKTGAHVFNLAGELATVEHFVTELIRIEPAAAGLVTAHGPQVPVAYRMRDDAVNRFVPGITKTPLPKGIRRTLDLFRTVTFRPVDQY